MTLNLKTQILTKNDCFKAGKRIKVKGAMLHSTGANNPKLSRYVGPDDGLLGKNPNNNDWNRPGIQLCVHAFIGKDKNGVVQAYQTLPWNYRAWGCGGAGNDMYIQVEICEDDKKDLAYFDAVYHKAVELFAYLAKQYDFTEKDILDHSEGFKRGVASNHGDVMHWFPKHGKSMDTFRADVKKLLSGKSPEKNEEPKFDPSHLGKSITQIAHDVIAGKYGSGEARKKALGSSYEPVQKMVNEILNGKKKQGEKTIEQLADEVMRGIHGSGRERMVSLGNKYVAVQQEVNRRMRK